MMCPSILLPWAFSQLTQLAMPHRSSSTSHDQTLYRSPMPTANRHTFQHSSLRLPNMSPPPRSHLIIVCCHGIWLGGPSRGADESEWLIADFQRGETDTFVEHIKAGVRALAAEQEDSVLVFSG